jgi:hypothetical protein
MAVLGELSRRRFVASNMFKKQFLVIISMILETIHQIADNVVLICELDMPGFTVLLVKRLTGNK